jgi:hypothetical protein
MRSNWNSVEIARFMDESVIPLRFSCIAQSGYPLVVSLWFERRGERIYCATQSSAAIVKHVNANGRCAFEIASERPPYRGTRGQGQALVRLELGGAVLESLIDRYLGERKSKLARSLLSKCSSEVAIEIIPEKTITWDYSSRMRGIRVRK